MATQSKLIPWSSKVHSLEYAWIFVPWQFCAIFWIAKVLDKYAKYQPLSYTASKSPSMSLGILISSQKLHLQKIKGFSTLNYTQGRRYQSLSDTLQIKTLVLNMHRDTPGHFTSQRSWLAKTIACSPTIAWLIINIVQWHSLEGRFARNA